MVPRRQCWIVLVVWLVCSVSSSLVDDQGEVIKDIPTPTEEHKHDKAITRTIDLKMKGAKPTRPDAYLCSSYSMEDFSEGINYIVKFEAMADVKTAHHILLFGCDGPPARSTDIWKCPAVCDEGATEQIMFAWAKAAPPTQLPKDVGFRVGRDSTIKNIVLQVHYKHLFNQSAPRDYSGIRIYVTPERQKYVAGIHLMLSYSISIPANTPMTHADISCIYRADKPMHPFAYRTHAHGLGRVISGYVFNNTWNQIGKGNPQWPQAFYPTNGSYIVNPGDRLVARCAFDSTGRNRITNIGATGADEMCNFYIMYYTDSSVKMPYSQCGGNRLPDLVANIPEDSDVPLSPNPALEEEAKGGHHHHHSEPAESSETEKKLEPLVYDRSWPQEKMKFGQIGGVTTDKEGNVYIFHRGSRSWDASSFDMFNKFQLTEAISEDVIVILDKEGRLVRKFGSNQFFMPHGIEVDSNGNIWVTDVALHQVMRIPKGKSAPDLVLGKAFMPDSDNDHFCKPADVAVLESGDFYVADGYCNSRILKYTANGTLLDEWGQDDFVARADGQSPPGAFRVVHSVTVAEDKDLVCVADRENGRIQCFDLDGKFRYIIRDESFGSRLFAITYCPFHGGILFAVNGPNYDGKNVPIQGFTLDVDNGQLLQKWNIPEGFKNPHDVAVDSVNHAVYVGQLNPSKVSRLSMKMSDQGKTLIDVPEKKGFTAKPTDSLKTPTQPPSVVDSVESGETTTDKKKEDKKSDYMPSIIIGALLIVPVVLLLVVTIIVRLHHTGKVTCFSGKKPKVFSLQSFLGNSHKGFDRLSTEESDHELDPLDDSDQEEYTAPSKKQKA